MTYDQFISQVQTRAQLDSRAAAVRATRATLITLAEHLAGNEPLDLASQLPAPFLDFLTEGNAGEGEELSVRDFLQRIRNREGVGTTVAREHAAVVLEVLREAVTPQEWEDVRSQLPPEYDALLAVPANSGTVPEGASRGNVWQAAQAGPELG